MPTANKFELNKYCDRCDANTIWYDGHCTKQHSDKYKDVTLRSSLGMSKEIPREPTEAEFRRMNRIQRKLLTVSDNHQSAVDIEAAWAYAYFGMDPDDVYDYGDGARDPSKTYCTFCGKQVDEINVLRGKDKPRIRFSDEPVMDPDTRQIHTLHKIHVFTEKVNACPTCVLQIRKPITVQTV